MAKDEERGTYPSASKFRQYSDCPGSYVLGLSVPPGETSYAAKRGINIHAGCAGEVDLNTLTRDERATVARLKQQEEHLLDTFLSDGWKVTNVEVETRLWGKATKSKWSGKPDKVFIIFNSSQLKTGAIIIDYKSTRYAGSAETNLQLAALVSLLDQKHNHEFDEIFVALVYPDGYDSTSYEADAIEEINEQCKSLVDAITETHTNVRKPSAAACRWCNAKKVCPERR